MPKIKMTDLELKSKGLEICYYDDDGGTFSCGYEPEDMDELILKYKKFKKE